MLYSNPLLNKFYEQANLYPDKKIIIETRGRSITLLELKENLSNVATNLLQRGFKKGDRVLVLVRPGIDAITCVLAVIRAGGVVVLADPGMGKDVFQSRVQLADPKWVFAESLLFPIQKIPFLKRVLKSRGIDIPELPDFKNSQIIRLGLPLPGSLGALPYNKLLKKIDVPTSYLESNDIQGTDEALIVFTSGTTALPKGVIHTVSSVNTMLSEILDLCKLAPQDVFYTSLTHFLLLAVSIGVIAVVPNREFTPSMFLNDLKKYKPTILFGPPAEFIALTNYCKQIRENVPWGVRKILLGSAPVLSGFLKKFITILPLHTQVTCMYGMTEILPVATIDGRKKATWEGQGDLLGSIIDKVSYRLEKDGELILKGPNLFKGYLAQEEVQEIATGDLVRVEKEQLVLIGRKKDMIIRGNYNIYPGLYESTIQKIPGVAACAMVGMRNESKEDEDIVLVIESDNSQDTTIIKRVESSIRSGKYSIDIHAIPDKVVVMNIPRHGRQLKIDKRKLLEVLKKEYL